MRETKEKIYIGLGSNLGDRMNYLRRAVYSIDKREDTKITKLSSVYETDPYGPQDQDMFLNAVIEIETQAEPMDFLTGLLAIENELGRIRTKRWGPRVIDLDLLLWGQRIIDINRLTIPHPEMSERIFVMTPLAEIAPEAIHPQLGIGVSQILTGFEDDKTARLYIERDKWLD
jgi:2-amino-4-hydroxy-6-hydroxymethyldihydropteridine diphosphokinase